MKFSDNKNIKFKQHHLFPESTVNSARRFCLIKNCSRYFRCKRVQCGTCYYIRRTHFIKTAQKRFTDISRLTHVVVKFADDLYCENQWFAFLKDLQIFSKAVSKKLKIYIRCIGVGNERGRLHVHYLLEKSDVHALQKAQKKLLCVTVEQSKQEVFSLDGLLGYFFDMNFYFAYTDEDRPKGTRVLASSRGIYCGFPTRKSKKVGENESLH